MKRLKFDKNFKIHFVTVLIVLIALQSTLTNCIKEVKSHFNKEDVYQPSLFDNRFEKLKDLPGSCKSVGYIENKETRDIQFIQYALAPVLVERGAELEYIIANTGVGGDIDFPGRDQYEHAEKIEGGFVLLKRKDNKVR